MTGEGVLGILALGFFLSLDNFRSSLAIGTVPFGVRRALQIALVFGFWDFVAPLAGVVLGHWFGDEIGEYADYVGPVLLGAYGRYLLIRAIRRPEPEEVDHPWVTLFGLPLSLSVDNLLAGTGLGVFGISR